MADILLITDIFPPDIGGPATFIDQLGRHLGRDDHHVTVFCTSERVSEPTDRDRPFRVQRYPRRRPSLRQRLGVRFALAQEVVKHRWVFTNGLEYPTFQVCSWLRRKYVLKVVGDSAWETARNTRLTRLPIDEFQAIKPTGTAWEDLVLKRTRFAQGAARVITPSNYLRQLVIGWGVAASRVVTVPNGIVLNEFAAYQPRHREGARFEIVYVGRLASWKGVDTLVTAAVGLRDTHVTIVGDGPELNSLVAQARQLHVGEMVTFAGRQLREAVLSHVSSAHVLVLDSSYEGLSHTLLEALATGVPCIASNCGGNPEVITHGDNGLLVPFGDAPRLHEALELLRADEDLRYRLAGRAKASSRNFDFDTTVRETARILLAE